VQTAYAIKEAGETFARLGVKVGQPELDFATANEWKAAVVKQLTQGVAGLFKANGVEWVKGSGKLKDPNPHAVEGGEEVRVGLGHGSVQAGRARGARATAAIVCHSECRGQCTSACSIDHASSIASPAPSDSPAPSSKPVARIPRTKAGGGTSFNGLSLGQEALRLS